MSKKEFVLKGRADAEGAAALLEDVLKCFKAGLICLSNGQEHLTLKPCANVDFVIEGQHKKGRQKLVLELAWAEDEAPSAAPAFSITSVEPEPAPEAPAEPQAAAASQDAAEAPAAAQPVPAAEVSPCDCIGSVPPQDEKEKPGKKGKKD